MCKTLMPDDGPLKRCKKCGWDDFYRNGKCKACGKAYAARYRQEKAEKVKVSNARYRQENAEKEKARKVRYRQKNPEKEKASQTRYRQKNPEKNRANVESYRQKNPEKVKARQTRFRSRKNFEHLLGGMLRLQEQETKKPENPQPTEKRD
jgi:hypothetical protein